MTTAWLQSILRRFKIKLNLPYQFQRLVRKKKYRAAFSKMSSRLRPPPEAVTGFPDNWFEQLNRDGLVQLGQVMSNCEIENLLARLEQYSLTDRFRPENGKFTLDNIPENTHVADYLIDDWSLFPEVLNVANRGDLISLASAYLGCKPTISNMQIWWSFPGHKEPEHAEFFHRDVDDWKFIKLFVYLTEVDNDSGPHVYVLGSKDKETWLPIRRYSDSEVINIFGAQSIKIISGDKGAGFLEDTFGFHKGMLPTRKARLVLQVQYSINPIRIQVYRPVRAEHSYDRYVNRLYLK